MKNSTCKSFCQLAKHADKFLVHLILKLCWNDVSKEFEEKLDAFRSHVKSVEKEAGMLSMIENHQGWIVAESERKGRFVINLFCYSCH